MTFCCGNIERAYGLINQAKSRINLKIRTESIFDIDSVGDFSACLVEKHKKE